MMSSSNEGMMDIPSWLLMARMMRKWELFAVGREYQPTDSDESKFGACQVNSAFAVSFGEWGSSTDCDGFWGWRFGLVGRVQRVDLEPALSPYLGRRLVEHSR